MRYNGARREAGCCGPRKTGTLSSFLPSVPDGTGPSRSVHGPRPRLSAPALHAAAGTRAPRGCGGCLCAGSTVGAIHPGIGYLRAFCEAALVGGLADWFAVTALFRRPLGLPIPHTAWSREEGPAGGSLGRVRRAQFPVSRSGCGQAGRHGLRGRSGRMVDRSNSLPRHRRRAHRVVAAAGRGGRGAHSTVP